MVAHLLRLKLTLLRNTLRRSPAALIGIGFAVLYGGTMLALAVVGLVGLRVSGAEPDTVATVMTLGGAALVLAWALVPVLAFGTDPTLDPARFATFSVPPAQLAAGLALSGVIGLPGLATVVLVLASVVAWSHSVVAATAALLAGTAGLATCVLLSRLITAAAAAALQSRRGRDLAAVGGLAALVGAASLSGVTGEGREPSVAALVQVADVLAWTPLGWAWAAPGDLLQGDDAVGALRLALALALPLGLFALWRAQLSAAVRSPRGPSAAGRSTGHGGLGDFGRLPGTPLGAVAARSAVYWRRDPRLNFPAVISALVPAMLVPAWAFGGSELALVGMPLVSAYLIGWGQHNDVGYDSTAFWMHVSAGVDGVSDRVGRLFPSVLLGAVCVPAYTVAAAWLGDRWDLLPATLGVALALLLSGLAVASVTSALKQYPVPRPGESPFATPPGGAGITLLVQGLAGSAVAALALPALALGVLAWFGHAWAGWAALVVGPGLGAVSVVAGVRAGARLFERRGPDLLQDLVRTR